jgi:drug/metabolite transporter (DMT)-like permease
MNWSLQHIPSGIGAILAATTPIWMVIFGAMFGVPTKLRRELVLGILVGLLGIAGIFRDYLTELLNPEFRWGILFGLTSTMTWCLGSVLTIRKKLSTHIIFGSGVQLIAAGVSMLILSLFVSDSVIFKPLGLPFYGALTYLVGIGSIVTFTAYVYMLTHLPPAKASIYAYVNPIVAILMGAAILGEKLTLNTLVFSLVTVAGIWLVNRSK